jgi:hypothetical protein
MIKGQNQEKEDGVEGQGQEGCEEPGSEGNAGLLRVPDLVNSKRRFS